jgi:hypothetical protein
MLKKKTVVSQMNEYQEAISLEKFLKPKLYFYPSCDQPSTVFDFDDLDSEDALLVLCSR